jgi:hypothetical protein
VKSRINEDFLKCYRKLPEHVQQLARINYRKFRKDHRHPSLQFKRLEGTDLYSVRVGKSYRALGTMTGDTITWFWIGSHAEYNQMIG